MGLPAKAATATAAALAFAAILAATIGPAQASPQAQASGTPLHFVTHGVTKDIGRVGRPPISIWPIPFGPKRKREMADYSERHYGQHEWRLRHPHVIVEHMAQASSVAAVHNTFAPDVPDIELNELPNVCAHFVVGSSGRIFRLVNLRTRCRHTVGLNWTAIGIEHVGYADSDVLGDRRRLGASLRLTQYLRCRFQIGVHDVIGHHESLTSPYHHELVPSLRQQTHGDWRHSAMRAYRRQLRRLGPC